MADIALQKEREDIMRARSAAHAFRAKARLDRELRNRAREVSWDPSPHLSCPPDLRGLKPITVEPWSRDAAIYARKTGSFERVYNADQFGTGKEKQEAYNDECALDSNNPDAKRRYRSRITATGLKRNASLGGQPQWDSSPLRHCPFVLRGISPVTREPWAIDEQIYNRDTTRDTTMDERGAQSHHQPRSLIQAPASRPRSCVYPACVAKLAHPSRQARLCARTYLLHPPCC